MRKFKRLTMTLALLIMAATGAWAQEYADYDIDVQFDNNYNPNETTFNCTIWDQVNPEAEPKGTLELSVDDVSMGSFPVDSKMFQGRIDPIDAGNHTWTAVFKPERGVAFIEHGYFTINKASAEITYNGPTSINLGVGESTNLDAYFSAGETDVLSYSSSDASVVSITKHEVSFRYIIEAKAAGTATITFSFAGSTNYNAIEEKKITVTVKSPEEPVEDFKWDATTKTGTFTMPESDVIVKVEYKSEATVSMNVDGTGGTAELMDATFQPLKDAKVKEGERFVLYLDRQDGYDFTTTFSKGGDTKEYMQEFSTEEYKNYINYAKEKGIQVPLNGALMWVTMPDTDDEALTMTTTFKALQTYTVLYKTTGSPTEVWARLGITENDAEVFRAVKMQPDMAMGDGTQVWSLKMQSAFDPKQVGFFTTEDAAKAEGAQTADAKVSQSATNWNNVNGGAQYLIIGGDARTVYAAFVTDGSKVRIYNEASATFNGTKADDKQGVSYRIAVCQGNNAGTVRTFIPTPPEGKEFGAWIAVKDKQEVIITDVRDYEISENTTFTAIWLPKQLSVSVNTNNGLDKSQSNIQYGKTLTLSEPTRRGFAFNGWAVDKTVTESGKLFGRGAAFDMTTPLTADLGLTAQWKHVHEYVKYQISQFGNALKNYQKYNGIFHIAICNCDDVELVAHEFNPAGKCACGYEKPGSVTVQLDIAYGQMNGSTFKTYMLGFPEFAKRGDEVKIDAPHMWGSNMQFKKWQYSTNKGQNWYDLAAFEIVGFLIPSDMQVRAIYESNVTQPQLELKSSNYLEPYTNNGQTYKMDNILFQMDYKLPDGYKLIDAGIRMGDNAGISYYEQKERRYSLDGEAKAIAIGMLAAVSILNGEPTTADMSASEQYWAERENSVFDELTPAALAKKMYESKPVNVPKYDPIYWEAKAKTKGLTGTIATLPPLRFAQKNNQEHYIYGMAYLRYKDKQGKEQAIYTPAIAATAKNPNGSVRRAQAEDEKLDMSTMLAPETQLTVNVDGKYDAQLSDAYGYGEKAVVTAPDVQGKQFSYWTTANGAVFSTSKEVTITMNANTKLNAVYGAEQKSAAPAITSATRNDNGQRIVLHAIATGDVQEAGFVYSTTNAEPTADAEGVTKVTAVSYSSLATNGGNIPASILDANNCWSLQITPAEQEQDAVHHVRAYVKNGNTITYGDVMDVRLASLKNELMMIANVDAFENGIETAGIEALLTQLREEGKLVAGYAVEVPAGEYATYYNDKVLKVEDTDAQLFTVTAIEDGKAVTEQVKVAAANTPLLVMNNSTETKTFLLMPTEDAADQVAVAKEFLGTLTDMTFTDQETKTANYYVCNGKEFIQVRGAGTLAANKAYLKVDGTKTAPASIPFRRSIDGEGEGTTGIDAIDNAANNDANATWYDLNGRKLNGKPAQKGVYIKNGRKVVVK